MLRPLLTKYLSNYGMAIVLVLLCLYYAYATVAEQNPEGAAAGKQVAGLIEGSTPKDRPILIIAREGAADTDFVTAAKEALNQAGYTIAATVQGSPRDARQAIEKLPADSKPITFAATAETANWPPLTNRVEGGATIHAPKPYRYPTFLRQENLLNVASQIVVIAILAVGLTLVILTGGIDLSVGSLIALSAVVTALLIEKNGGAQATPATMLLASAAGILLCAALGAFSGAIITFFRVPPFIATLAMMLVASGLAFKLCAGQTIYDLPDSYAWLGRDRSLLGIPNSVVLMALVFLAAGIMTARMRIGRYIYAVGGNPEAARLSGVRVGFILMLVYILSGLTAGLGGVIFTSQLKSGAPTYGTGYELYAIAAVVVGGTSLTGGSGTILGTLIGALIIAVIQNGMNLTGIQSYNQRIVLGLVILGAVLLDMLKKQSRWPRFLSFSRKP